MRNLHLKDRERSEIYMTGLQSTSYHYQCSLHAWFEIQPYREHKTFFSCLSNNLVYLGSLEVQLQLAESMRKEIIIRMQPGSDRYHKRALKVAAAVSGVASITVAGRDSDLLLVIGDGVDESVLIKKLRRVVGEAEIVELRTLAAGSSGSGYLPGTSRDVAAAQYPVSARSPLANTGAARWSGDHRRAEAAQWTGEQYRQPEAGYYPHAAPSPSYYQASPLAGNGGYGGSGYARAAARSHPGNYSPMIERHDYLAGGSSHLHGGGRQPKCCSIQ